ncbi:hypothetical protein PQO03_16825 [Lentisphaera profundi]|uniref:Uncharacterized protein n=1 Tax=Lentisphaera profundi TaxID=1658616 RepID=A0ABY7VW43_9BACT|nr:hypothetical protein [Lentisphaera profundi]WDE97493.1 hypothetical protein PQO03_16825 [Lentisphaera profundi]
MSRILISLITCLIILSSCAPVSEAILEENYWEENGSYKDHSWQIIKDGERITLEVDNELYQLYPEIKIANIEIKRCGISSTGPASTDHQFQVFEHGAIYKKAPYSYRFKRNNSLHIISLSKEKTTQGELHLESSFSFNLDSHTIELKEVIKNPSDQVQEVQFSYLIKTPPSTTIYPNYKSIFPLLSSKESDYVNWDNTKPLPAITALNYDSDQLLLLETGDKYLSFSQDSLPYISVLKESYITLGTSYYQNRSHERKLGRVGILEAHESKTYRTKIKILHDIPNTPIKAIAEPKFESLDKLLVQ